MHSSVTQRVLWVAGTAVAIALMASSGIDAHKGITSKYTYNDDVYPILRDKCGRCHVDGGPTPMSLLSYQENGGAVAWAESIREMLVSQAMPPWYADPTGPAVRNAHSLTPLQLDTLLTWAVGGTPQGDLHKMPPPSSMQAQWTLGKPDLALQLEKDITLPPGTMEQTVDVTLPTNLMEAKWVKAADLLPSTPAIVRSATIGVEDGPMLAVWEPGDDATSAPGGAAFKLPAGAKLHVHIRYKKGWQDEQNAKSDRSTVGLYFTDEPLSGKDIQSFVVDAPAGEAPSTFSGELATNGRVVALRPLVDQPYATMDITAVAGSGRRIPLLKLRGIRPEWPRRYWLADPIELPKGAKIEVTTKPGDPDSGPLAAPVKSPLQVALDIVPQ
jgi:hypothetical protein